MIDFALLFDDVLDETKLVRALEKLVEKPGWKRLGGRLRMNVRLAARAETIRRILKGAQ